MKIVFLITQSIDSPGGGGRFLPIAKSLVKHGFSVRLICLHPNFDQLIEHSFVIDGVIVDYVAQMHVKKIEGKKYYFNIFQLFWIVINATIKLTIGALKHPFDAIQVCKAQPMNGIAAWILHLITRKPVFLDSDDYETFNNRYKYAWEKSIVALFEKWIPSFSIGITVSNYFLAGLLENLGVPRHKIRIVPHGYDPKRFECLNDININQQMIRLRNSLSICPGSSIIVFIGSMSLTCHAIDLLLNAFVEVLQEKSTAILVMVGGGEDYDQVKTLAQELHIDQAVRFVGKVELDQVPYYFKLGNVSVDPKYNSFLEKTTISLKITESIAAGIPCVTADIGDRRSIVGEAGILVEPGNVHSLAQGIMTVLNNPEIENTLRAKAKLLSPQYSWDNLVDTFVEQYSKE